MDKIFKETAKEYIEKQGEELLREDVSHVPDFDIPLFKKRKIRRGFILTCSTAAAAILIMFVFWRMMPRTSPGNMVGSASTPASETAGSATAAESAGPSLEITQLSARLPAGSRLLDTKYDTGETVYTIENDLNNTIVISVKPLDVESAPETETFIPVDVNGNDGYMLIKRDYKMLTVQSDGLLYKLTSAFDAGDLYTLAAALI